MKNVVRSINFIWKQTVTLLAVSLPFFVAQAGGINGGGGKGVMCDGHLEVLDLYEARRDGLKLPAPLGNTDAEIDRFGLKILRHFSSAKITARDQENSLRFMKAFFNDRDSELVESYYSFKSQTNLEFTNDATLPPIPKNCRFVQIAVNRIIESEGSEKVEITSDPELMAKLDSLNLMAIFIHEFAYSRARTGYAFNDRDRAKLTSDESRKVVARLFATEDLPSIVGPVVNSKEKVWCGFGGGERKNGIDEHFEVYIREEKTKWLGDGIGLYFYGFKGMLVSSRTYTFIPDMRLKDLKPSKKGGRNCIVGKDCDFPKFQTVTVPVFNDLMDAKWTMELGTYQYGLKIRAYASNQFLPNEPDFSLGFCVYE